jgi:hypothetical protein
MAIQTRFGPLILDKTAMEAMTFGMAVLAPSFNTSQRIRRVFNAGFNRKLGKGTFV